MASVAPSDAGVFSATFSEDFICCPVTCLTQCCIPSTICCVAPCLLQGHKTLKKRYGNGCMETKWKLSHSVQKWLLTHPTCGSVVGCCGCCLTLANLHDINYLGGSMYRGYHDLFGESFVACGKVLTAEPQVMERCLTGPMVRGGNVHFAPIP